MNKQNIAALWAHLHWLTILAQQGSFTSAAARLGVSKAAMSQRIAELELAAGVPLVRRTTRSVRLTEAGQQLVEETQGAFDQIAHSFSNVHDLAVTPRGLLRVTAPAAFARQQLVPRLPEFSRTYPEVRLELELSDTLSSLALEGFDLAIRHTATPPDTHVAWALCTTRSLLVAHRSYLDRCGTPQTPTDLVGHALLHYFRSQGAPTWTFEKTQGRDKTVKRIIVPAAGPLAVNNSEALRDAALGGMGIALVPDFSAQAALRTHDLIEVLPDWRTVGAFGQYLYAIRPYSSHVPRAVQALVAYLRQAFAGGFGD